MGRFWDAKNLHVFAPFPTFAAKMITNPPERAKNKLWKYVQKEYQVMISTSCTMNPQKSIMQDGSSRRFILGLSTLILKRSIMLDYVQFVETRWNRFQTPVQADLQSDCAEKGIYNPQPD